MNYLDTIIIDFEKQQFYKKEKIRNLGVIYTPIKITQFMVINSFKTYIEGYYPYFKDLFQRDLLQNLETKSLKFKELRTILNPILDGMKILDPACGSGRFLIAAAEYLLELLQILNEKESTINLKRKIIESVIFGNDIDEKACLISKLRLLNWFNPKVHLNSDEFIIKGILNFDKLNFFLDNYDLNFNILCEDFLMQSNNHNFDIIIGNPPYVENKKINNSEYKKSLVKKFTSAYKLFDLSILFIEQSLTKLKEKNGVLAFLIPNKFLAADYGVKIRELLLENTQIKEIINISSLSVFKKISIYPIMLFLIRNSNHQNSISIKKVENINQLKNKRWNESITFDQKKIEEFPLRTIPLSKNIEFINQVFSKFDSLATRFPDLKIIYRPFGFINWVKGVKNVCPKLTSDKDLILLGTGSISKFFIDFTKRIKIAERAYRLSYFSYSEEYDHIWNDLSKKKLIFREIAKDLTFVYDPGLFVNLTGLYFISVPSLNENQLFSLLSVLNSDIINDVFKSLFGTLHMSQGYLRINGSFIKRIPIPDNLPNYLSLTSKILQFLSQLKYDLIQNVEYQLNREIDLKKINNNLKIFQYLNNTLVNQLYGISKGSLETDTLIDITKSLPHFKFKYFFPYYDTPRYKVYTIEEILSLLEKIENSHTGITF